MGRPALIDRLGIADDVLAMARRGVTQDEIAKWVSGVGEGSIGRAAVSRWLAANRDKRVAQPEVVERLEHAETVTTEARVKGRRQSTDSRYFMGQLKAIVEELRSIATNENEHPQLRAEAAKLVVDAAIEGQELSMDFVERRDIMRRLAE